MLMILINKKWIPLMVSFWFIYFE